MTILPLLIPAVAQPKDNMNTETKEAAWQRPYETLNVATMPVRYVSVKMATEADWERWKEQQRVEIRQHEDAIQFLDREIEERRRLGVTDPLYIDWNRARKRKYRCEIKQCEAAIERVDRHIQDRRRLGITPAQGWHQRQMNGKDRRV